jgi:K+-sensing histidine kinase KdpD
MVETSDQPADAITGYAKQAEIDLIVMGTHGRHGISHLLVGSVAERVVRTASCPVLTVKHPSTNSSFPTLLAPAGSEAVMIALKKILVAT